MSNDNIAIRKKIYLLNGKLIYNLAVRYNKGLAHADMSDWITHAVNDINKNKDVVLIVKAHRMKA